MSKWEYKFLKTEGNPQHELDKLGEDGWELVSSVNPAGSGNQASYGLILIHIFKRPNG